MKKKVKNQLALLITIVVFYTVMEMYGVTALHFRYVNIVADSVEAVNCISRMRSHISEVDSCVLKLVAPFDDNQQPMQVKDYVIAELETCDEKIAEYRDLPKNELEEEEFKKLCDLYDSYKSTANEICYAVESNSMDKAVKTYNDNFISYRAQMATSSEKLYDLAFDHQEDNMHGAALRRDITANGTTLISIIFLIVLIRMDRKRMRTEKELIQTEEKVVKQKEKISTAVLKDVLTDTENRMSFINNFADGKTKVEAGQALYFVMFNIDDFSSVNSTYGVKSGDLILNSSAKKIMSVFEGCNVYRTGSDEFVVAVPATSDDIGYSRVSGLIERARDLLSTANQIKTGSLVVSYSVSVVKKTGPCGVDASVLGPLKESMKQGRLTQPGAVMFTELN